MTAVVPAVDVDLEQVWLLKQLPALYRDDDFFSRFVALFDELGQRTNDIAEMLPDLADVTITPAPMVRYIAGWLGVNYLDPALPMDRQRKLVAQLGGLLGWRGTERGLIRLLEVLTEGDVRIEDGGGVYADRGAPRNPKRVTVHVSTAGQVPIEQLADLVRDEIPADCRLVLRVGGQLVPPRSRRLRERT